MEIQRIPAAEALCTSPPPSRCTENPTSTSVQGAGCPVEHPGRLNYRQLPTGQVPTPGANPNPLRLPPCTDTTLRTKQTLVQSGSLLRSSCSPTTPELHPTTSFLPARTPISFMQHPETPRQRALRSCALPAGVPTRPAPASPARDQHRESMPDAECAPAGTSTPSRCLTPSALLPSAHSPNFRSRHRWGSPAEPTLLLSAP